MKLVGLRVVASTKRTGLIDLSKVKLHCGKSRWGYIPSLMTWSYTILLEITTKYYKNINLIW